MTDRARCVLVDRNDWFRELVREELESLGVELVGEARDCRVARDVLTRRLPDVVVVTPELEERGEGIRELLAAVVPERCPALVLLGQFRTPKGFAALGGCGRVGKYDGIAALVGKIRAEAEKRRELMNAVAGAVDTESAADTLLKALDLAGKQTGCGYLRFALLQAAAEGGPASAKRLYADTAARFSVTDQAVERDIRFAVSAQWRGSSVTNRMMLFGSDVGEAPGNLKLIRTLAGLLRARARSV